MAQNTASRLHWNYFLALERDLEVLSRYVEFDKANYRTYSIELARLLFAAASEIDVIAKALCERLAPDSPRTDMDQYRAVLVEHLPKLRGMEAVIPRYSLRFTPWAELKNDRNPDWWTKYNNVKHRRDRLFHEGNLRNALSAMSALLLVIYQFYRYACMDDDGRLPLPKETTHLMQPTSSLLMLPDEFYYDTVISGHDSEPQEYFHRAPVSK
jgi:hypothetical protein